ncbi:MAG: AsmA-like C-terminal region-containing protein [Opitutales bacterium]
MSNSGRAGAGALIELFIDGLLLLFFIVQAFLLGCFFLYGHLPLPSKWVGESITSRLPPGISVDADRFSLTPDGTIRMENIQLYLDGMDEAVFTADYAHAAFALQWDKNEPVYLEECVLSKGLLLLPAIHSPTGSDSTILDDLALRLRPVEGGIRVDSLAARHEDIRLRGSIDWTAGEARAEAFNARETAELFFQRVGYILKQKQEFDRFTRPTILFQIDATSDGPFNILGTVSSRAYQHPDLEAKNLTLRGRLSLTGRKLVSTSSILLKADALELPAYHTRASSITAKIEREEAGALLNGEWPDMEAMAETIDIRDLRLETPRIQLSPRAFPEISFSGFTSGLQGAVEFSGTVDAETERATIQAAGSLDLLAIAPDKVADRLPAITVNQAPYYNLSLQFDKGFALNHAELRTRVDALEVEGLDFDHIRFRGDYREGVYSIDRSYLRRGQQWLELGLNLDRASEDYALSLKGFAKPDDYNPILPRWWEKTFREFDFEQTRSGLGDFVIYGNTRQKAADFFFGHAKARNLAYKGVRVDEGQLFVRGRGRYAEVHQLDARSGEGYVRGNIRFASRADEVRGPMSVRLDLETRLPLTEAKKLFDEDIATILSDFDTEALPHTVLRGAIFNRAYPEFEGLSYIDLTATCPDPLTYKGLSLESLSFDLRGREGITYLRDIELGYAGGTARAKADIINEGDGPAQTRFQLSLEDADQDQAIDQLTALKDPNPDKDTEKSTPGAGRLDLELHASGPANDLFQMQGYGSFHIKNEALHAIQLFGPLSELLQNIRIGFTSFALEEMQGSFALKDETVRFEELEINGPRTRIEAPGTMGLEDFSLAMRVSVYLFGNTGKPDSKLRKFGDLVTRPIPNILEFELTGTPDEQKWRSLYDPRKFIPQF